MRKNASVFWKIEKTELEKLVKSSKTFTELLSHFDRRYTGGNWRTIRKRLDIEKIDYSHIPIGYGANKGKKYKLIPFDFDSVLIKESTYARKNLKKRLLDSGLLHKRCYAEGCTITDEWNGHPITLHLDHKNGIKNDNRLENLHLLCPNCHSQTATYSGRNVRNLKMLDNESIES